MLGDVIDSLPFVRGAATAYDVFVCCHPSTASIYRQILPPDRVFSWQAPWADETRKYAWKKIWDSRPLDLLRTIRKIKPRATLTVWADARVHLLMRLSGAPRRVGFAMNKLNYYAWERPWRTRQLKVGQWLEKAAAVLTFNPLLTQKLDRSDYLQNHLHDWRQLSLSLGLPFLDEPPWLPLPGFTPEPGLEDFLSRARLGHRQIWLIHPGARTPNRRWPAANFLQIADRLLQSGSSVLLVVPPEMEIPPFAHPHLWRAEPRDLMAFYLLLSQADRVLCNDTGVSHLAASLGKRTVTLFSANRPEWFAPRGSHDLAVNSTNCPIKPCLDRCEMPSYICLEGLTLQAVMDKVAAASHPESSPPKR